MLVFHRFHFRRCIVGKCGGAIIPVRVNSAIKVLVNTPTISTKRRTAQRWVFWFFFPPQILSAMPQQMKIKLRDKKNI
jgi:hypothetical protein